MELESACLFEYVYYNITPYNCSWSAADKVIRICQNCVCSVIALILLSMKQLNRLMQYVSIWHHLFIHCYRPTLRGLQQ